MLTTSGQMIEAWRAADAVGRDCIVSAFFQQAWADLTRHLAPQTFELSNIRNDLPHAVQTTQVFGDDGEEIDAVFTPVNVLTFGELKAAISILCAAVLREAEYLKVLSYLVVSLDLSGAVDRDLVFPNQRNHQ